MAPLYGRLATPLPHRRGTSTTMLDQDSILSWVVLALVVVFVAISFSLAAVRRRRADGLHSAWATGDALPPSAAVRAPLQAADEAPPTATAGSPSGCAASTTRWYSPASNSFCTCEAFCAKTADAVKVNTNVSVVFFMI